jgi:preprotein translocase YajC subunit
MLTKGRAATIPTEPARPFSPSPGEPAPGLELTSIVSLTLFFQPVGPKAGTPGIGGNAANPGSAGTQQDSAPAAASHDPQAGSGSMWVMMAPLFIVMVVMLFMNRGQKKKDAEIRAKLKKGDRVVSHSGIVGELVEMDDRIAKVKIAPGTNVSMLISTVGPYEVAPARADDKQLKDLKEAKAAADKK